MKVTKIATNVCSYFCLVESHLKSTQNIAKLNYIASYIAV